MVHVGVRNEPLGRSHEGPWLSSEVETEFQFGNPPVRLHSGAGKPFDGQPIERQLPVRRIGIVLFGRFDTHALYFTRKLRIDSAYAGVPALEQSFNYLIEFFFGVMV